MNHRWRKIDGINYLMRDGKTTAELRELYKRVVIKYPGTKLTFHQFLVRHGKVYTSK